MLNFFVILLMGINHDARLLNDCFLFTWSVIEQLEGGAIPKNRRNAKISKNVQFLKKNDFHDANGGICMSTQSEMSKIKRSDHLKQFKRNVEFDADMSDDMVKEHLEATFPYLRGRR